MMLKRVFIHEDVEVCVGGIICFFVVILVCLFSAFEMVLTPGNCSTVFLVTFLEMVAIISFLGLR